MCCCSVAVMCFELAKQQWLKVTNSHRKHTILSTVKTQITDLHDTLFPAQGMNLNSIRSSSVSYAPSLRISRVEATTDVWRGYLSPTDDFH